MNKNKKIKIINMFFYVYIVIMFLFLLFLPALLGTQDDGEIKIEPVSEENVIKKVVIEEELLKQKEESLIIELESLSNEELSDVKSAITNKIAYSKKGRGVTEEEKFIRSKASQIMEARSWAAWESKHPKLSRENIQGTVLIVAVVSTAIIVTLMILDKTGSLEKLI